MLITVVLWAGLFGPHHCIFISVFARLSEMHKQDVGVNSRIQRSGNSRKHHENSFFDEKEVSFRMSAKGLGAGLLAAVLAN